MRPAISKMMLPIVILAFVLSLAAAQNNADVLILGAGTAGIVAAGELASRNVSFLIVEGAGVIGGRLRSTMFGGIRVEEGTSLFYGTNASLSALIAYANISGNYLDYESVIVRTSNGTMPETESEAAWQRLATSQMKVKDLYGKIKKEKIPDMSIRVALEYGNWFPKNPIDDVVEIYDYDFEFSKIPELISTLGFEDTSPYQSRPYMSTDQRGLQDIPVRYARTFNMEMNDPRLKLNEVVDRISHTGSLVSVSTKSGKTFTGKYAIVTFSMGVLKSGSVTFEPPLPEWKLDTIYKTSMDAYAQVYVKFTAGTNRFWENYQFILHASPRRGYYPIIWNMEADGFYPTGTNMISFQVMGEEARRIERLPKAVIKAEITEVLRKMYGPSTPEPEDILVTKWLDDPLAMGSFSSRQVGDNNPRFMDALTSPVGRLYFAGEAYDDIFDGFLEGARISADNTVKKLYECMKNRKCHQFNTNPPRPAPPTRAKCGATGHKLSFVVLFVCFLSVLSFLYSNL